MKFERDKLDGFLTISSVSPSLRKKGSGYSLVKLISYKAVLNSKTGNLLQDPSKCHCKSMSWLLCNCRTCAELFSEELSFASIPTQIRWFRTSKIRARLSFIVVSFWTKFIFHWSLLRVSRVSRPTLRDDTKSRGLGLHRKFGSCLKFDGIVTKIGTSFPIHVFVSVSSQSSSSIEIDWKSENKPFVKESLVVCKRVTKLFKFTKQFFTELIHLLRNFCLSHFVQVVTRLSRLPHLLKYWWYYGERHFLKSALISETIQMWFLYHNSPTVLECLQTFLLARFSIIALSIKFLFCK